MQGINKVILIGTMGRDPEMQYSASGTAVCTISVATSESWKDKSGEKVEKTEWHRVVAFQKLAEIMGKYLVRALLSISRANCRPGSGRIRMAMTVTRPRSLPGICRCSAASRQRSRKDSGRKRNLTLGLTMTIHRFDEEGAPAPFSLEEQSQDKTNYHECQVLPYWI